MNAISMPVQTVLDLFAEELADVRFGDIDTASLAAEAEAVQAAASVVTLAQCALDVARASLQERQDTLLLQAQRALAHARVYAEANEALSARLEAIALPRPVRRPRNEGSGGGDPREPLVLAADGETMPRRRGRPRKVTSVEPTLEGMLSATGE